MMPYDQRPASPPPRSVPPSSIVNAVRLMYAGAAMSVISLIALAAGEHSLRTGIEQRYPTLIPSQVSAAVTIVIIVSTVPALVGVGLWLWMAWANRRGQSWARIVSSVYFGILTVAILAGLGQASTVPARISGIIEWAVGLAAIVLLWQRQSSYFYNGISAPVRYARPPRSRPGPLLRQPGRQQPGPSRYQRPGNAAGGGSGSGGGRGQDGRDSRGGGPGDMAHGRTGLGGGPAPGHDDDYADYYDDDTGYGLDADAGFSTNGNDGADDGDGNGDGGGDDGGGDGGDGGGGDGGGD